ncbi:hypothetical protein TPY_0215 [Sulfobacillus acidophilus TPY]|uniref:Uncharacterized protein n=1 Tax=Sulfobacillus acidophilus (strain ATCC 700253 / DSM 10332 / NAL) TaxID=679936 RepID=G8TWC4_SULAD|nr:hypothetical protein TPY_0215 [Sulfobacillus acidophilus TPY]AEW03767.1 hypothetical protein Sulac_0195 [Sulfobacillus acidophilus DSM 10332]
MLTDTGHPTPMRRILDQNGRRVFWQVPETRRLFCRLAGLAISKF